MTRDPFLFDTRQNLPFCGCGNPDAALVLIRRVLEVYAEGPNFAGIQALLPDIGVRMLVLGAIDQAKLLEHGGSIEGSWLTDDGKRFLAAMQAGFDPSDEDSVIAWIDDISSLAVAE